MKLLLFLILLSSQTFAADYRITKYGPYPMTQVARYLDGDTFEGWVSTYIRQTTFIRIRIRGIDAPEKRGVSACEKLLARRATEKLKSILESATFVMLDNLGYDSFGRILADVRTDAGDVGQLMIQSGYAHKYSERNTPWCVSG